jgi:hypothetical protein
LRLEWHGTRICDLLLGPPPNRAHLADSLDKASRLLGVELAMRWEVGLELEDLRTLATQVWDLVLDNADGPSSLAASLSIVAEFLEGQVDATTANGVHWGTRLALDAALSHFPELEAELELLGSRRNVALMEDRVDALWILACQASNLLSSYALPSVARSLPDDVGE